jgi:hypothetical protein
MARTAVHVTEMTPNTAVADPTGTTADTTNDHVIDVSAYPTNEILIRIKQTDASARVATIKAGDNPPADAAGQGDLTKSMAQNEVWWIGPLTSARFIQNDGTILVDLATSFAGTIEVFHIPRTA